MASQQQPVSSSEPPLQVTRSVVFPLLGGRSTWGREHLLPIFVTVCVAMALMVLLPAPSATASDEIRQVWVIFYTLAVYIAFLVAYYVNQMCGRPKRLWVLAVVALATALLMGSPLWPHWYVLFYNVIPGDRWESSSNLVAQLAGWWFGTGLCEEGFKALPLIGLALLGAGLGFLSRRTHGRPSRIWASLRKHIGLCGPRDGIVLGVASGAGFFITETLGQYVPKMMGEFKHVGGQAFNGLLLLLGRGLPDLTGHSAYSGLFGYFIGLSVLRPKMAIYLLPLGWLSAAALHGAWDATGNMIANSFVQLAIWLILALLSYGLLGGAIFKADDISAPQPLQAVPATAALGSDDDSG
jgi:RsiW-degrading membrane proteinase PrsW (M82 family)